MTHAIQYMLTHCSAPDFGLRSLNTNTIPHTAQPSAESCSAFNWPRETRGGAFRACAFTGRSDKRNRGAHFKRARPGNPGQVRNDVQGFGG